MSSIGSIPSVYKNFTKFPILCGAKFLLKNANDISSSWTVTDLVSAKSKVINMNFQVDEKQKLVYKSPIILKDEEVLMDVISQSCKYRATCLERKNPESLSKDSKINLVYVWSEDLLLKTISLTDLDAHGPVYKISEEFGGFQWLQDGKKILYIADSKKVKKLSHFQTAPKENSSKSIEIGNQYLHMREFGEQLDYVRDPVICILDVEEEKIEVLDSKTLCFQHTIGDINANPNGEGFAFTAYNNMPFQLGLRFCTQRPCGLFYYDCESKSVSTIGDQNKTKMSPKISPDGKFLIWLENDVGGPHLQCQRLMRYDFLSRETSTVVDIVRSSQAEFPGIYCDGLINNCFTEDGKYVFLNSIVRCHEKILSIHLESGNVKILNQDNINGGNQSLLDTNNNNVLVSVSAPDVVPYLAIGNIEKILSKGQLNLNPISSVHKLDDILRYEIIDHEPIFAHSKYGKIKYQSIFIESKIQEPCPLILILHGGPHGSITTQYLTFIAVAAKLGYHSLVINYRGSLGFGQDSLESLLGHISEMDVSDCIKACEDAINKFASKIDKENIFVYGGSHGGFLGVHLAAKYADKARAVAIRNPVINLVSMLTSTDIPDWIYTESGYQWDYNYLFTNDKIISCWEKSPLKFVDQIKCPILIMLGQEDKRVPISQGIELYRTLKARSGETDLHVYPKDNHALSSVEANSDCLVNIFTWFNNNIKK